MRNKSQMREPEWNERYGTVGDRRGALRCLAVGALNASLL